MTEAFRRLAWTEPAVDLVRLGCFLVFLALGWMVSRHPDSRARVDRLLAYVLGITLLVGLLQQESWPFTHWALVNHVRSSAVVTWEMEGLDRAGRAYLIDPRVLQPLAPEDFGAWMLGRLPQLAEAGASHLGQFLLGRAETGRLEFRAGHRFPANARILGPLAAPYHFHARRLWRHATDVPDGPFVALRVWELRWDAEERFRGGGETVRRLLLDFDPGRTAAPGSVR